MYMRNLVLAAVLFFAGPAEATLINGDFETGDLTGWTTIGSALPTSNEQAIDYSLAPGGFPVTTLPLVPTYSGGTFGGFIRTGSGIERGFSQLVSVTPSVALNFSLDFALREVQGAFGAGTVIKIGRASCRERV